MSRRKDHTATGVAIGVGVGLAIGTSLDNVSAGLPIGIGCGLVWAQWMNRCARSKTKDQTTQNDSDQP